jgi:hypothetical protein
MNSRRNPTFLTQNIDKGWICSSFVYQNARQALNVSHRQGAILAIFPPNPQAEQKERSHE